MRKPTILCALLGLLLSCQTTTALTAEPMISHDVYFTLKQDSDDARERLLAGCKKYLADHSGVVWFAAGVLVESHQREVNDRDFDVALHMVFEDKASHDKYQQADRHHKFIEEFQESWQSVRVFDSYVNTSSHAGMQQKKAQFDKAKALYLPDDALRFAGMIQGKVVANRGGEMVLAVAKVLKTWRTNEAANPKALAGKKVVVICPVTDGRRVKTIARFLDGLRVGETVTLDVAHQAKREVLTILELTLEQRERVSEK